MSIALATLGALGGLFGVRALVTLIPGSATLRFNTAIGLFCAGISLVLKGALLRAVPGDSGRRSAALASRALALVTLTIGALTLLEYLLGQDFGIDQLFVKDPWIPPSLHPGRPTWFAALGLMIVSAALLFAEETRSATFFQVSALALGASSWLCLAVFLFHGQSQNPSAEVQALPANAALIFMTLAYGILWLRVQSGLMQVLLSQTVAGFTARRLIPLGVLLPGLLGWFYLETQKRAWWSPETGIIMITAAGMLAYVLTAWRNARVQIQLEGIEAEAKARTEQALRQAEGLAQRLQLATKVACVGIWEWDLDTNLLSWDPLVYEFYGLSPTAGPPSLNWWRAQVLPEDLALVNAQVQAAFAQDRDVHTEFRVKASDGSIRSIEARATVERDAAGKPVRLLGANMDVTAQRDAEARLRDSEQRFRAIFQSAFQFLGLLTPEGRLLEANQAALEYIGQDSSQVKGKPFWETPWWPEDEAIRSELKDAVQRAARGEFVRYRVPHQGKDGETSLFDFSLKPIRDDKGKVVLLLPEGRNIDEFEHARRALAESEERFRTAMEYAPIGNALVGLDGRFLKVNRALCSLVGYSEEELCLRTFQDITHPEDLESDLAHARELLAGEISHYRMDKRYLHKDGHVVWVALSGALARGEDGEPLMFIAQVEDITQQRAHEAELRRSVAEKEVLLKEIHHRVKNNVQVISSMLRLQEHAADAPEVRGMFKDSQARIQAMALIHDRLYRSGSLAAIDFGEHLRELVSLLIRMFRGEREIQLTFALEPVSLSLDVAIPMGLIANELVTNALKHAFPGRARGALWVELLQKEDALTLVVADDGVGLPDAAALEKRKFLGMRLIDALVRQLHGSIRMQKAGRTEITVTVPLTSER